MKSSIITHISPKDPISEAFRNMRTNITFSNIDEQVQVLTVTSTTKAEGKTTIITNYAVALAQSKKKVLLIDCDLRRPKIHRMLDLENIRGLTNILLKEADAIESIQATEVENLFVVTSGPIPPNPSEILGSKRLGELLERYKKAFDYILIDAPPIGVVTDAAVLSQVTDGYVIVASLNIANKEGVRMALETLNNVNANIVGVVANNVPMTKRSGYYYYYYYSGYESVDEDNTKRKVSRKEKKKNRNK